jgi:uncharacterized membrane protein YeaQ/YmgE (transglycosylase-associated protein family)
MIAGCIVYLIPAAIRYATGSIIIPFLNWPGYWIEHFVPGNLSEKILVNMVFPGAVGAIAGEVFAASYLKQALTSKAKYLCRLAGALVFVSVWSLFQLWGYSMSIYMSFSPASNLFESYFVFPINYIIACFSIITPTILYFIKNRVLRILKR